ncbi:lasso RiPP family leader peptide-containing protein [Floridanema aerugineum]|jgi:hypothetical protein|uniref:Lasso RiPP family leader peptide-containing protein n=1 Tax=Floridaenema aerugineum BLCC-F46 TaxID=3153654 RepID=A0ABV4XE79_9CYAN
MKSNNAQLIKREYHSPKLLVYGNIRELTQGGGSIQNWDGAAERLTTSNPCGFGNPNPNPPNCPAP